MKAYEEKDRRKTDSSSLDLLPLLYFFGYLLLSDTTFFSKSLPKALNIPLLPLLSNWTTSRNGSLPLFLCSSQTSSWSRNFMTCRSENDNSWQQFNDGKNRVFSCLRKMSNTPLHLWWLQVLGETAPQWLLIWCFLEGYPAVTGYDRTAGKRKKRETVNRQITLIFHYKQMKKQNPVEEWRLVVTLRPYKHW